MDLTSALTKQQKELVEELKLPINYLDIPIHQSIHMIIGGIKVQKLSTCTDDEFTFQAVINKKSVFCQAIVDIA